MPEVFREFFDGIAEHGAGHLAVAGRFFAVFRMTGEGRMTGRLRLMRGLWITRGRGLAKPGFQCGLVPFSGLAEEPANGFVDEVVGVVKEDVGYGEGVGELPVADEGHGAHNADSLFPDGTAVLGKAV